MTSICEEAARESAWLRDTDRVLAIVAEPPPTPQRLTLARTAPDDKRALWLTHPPCLPVSNRGEDA